MTSPLLTFEKLKHPKSKHDRPSDIERASLARSFRPTSVTKKKRSKAREAGVSEELASQQQTSNANHLKVLARREVLNIPEPPSFDLTILQTRKKKRALLENAKVV